MHTTPGVQHAGLATRDVCQSVTPIILHKRVSCQNKCLKEGTPTKEKNAKLSWHAFTGCLEYNPSKLKPWQKKEMGHKLKCQGQDGMAWRPSITASQQECAYGRHGLHPF